MADKLALLEHFLSCYVCSETFRDPVSLSCNHNFCSSCLQDFWKQAGNQNCPICKRKSSKSAILVNFGMKKLADSFAGRVVFRSEMAKEEIKSKAVCSRHQEEPRLFCVDEQRALCPVCEFSLHHTHNVIPVEQAVSAMKEQLKRDLKSLQNWRDKHKEVQEAYKKVNEHRAMQLKSTEGQIRAEFNKLQQFLKEDEEARLAALREENEQRKAVVSKEVKLIEEQMALMSDSMRVVEEELQKEGNDFLSSFKAVRSQIQSQEVVPVPQLVLGTLIDVAQHVGNLAFRVWEKMKDKVHFAPVILDPNTAHPDLSISDDLSSVSHGYVRQQLPDNPERQSRYPFVLGSEGFSFGTHRWEVEVGDHPSWTVGVVEGSVSKDTQLTFPNVLWFKNDLGVYTGVNSQTFTLKKKLQRICIQLDYSKGEVSFYEAEEMTLITTYSDIFIEKLFPYFSVGEAGEAKTKVIKICHTQH